MKFTHLLLTLSDYRPDYPDLANRVRLFRSLTVPSIAAQTCSDFVWLVQTQNPEMIAELAGLPNARAVVCAKRIPPIDTPWLITSRVDNDDVLLPQYIERIQAEFHERKAVIDCRGYRWSTETGEVVYFDHYARTASSPFASLIEPAVGAVGVRSVFHRALPQLAPVTMLPDRLWVQVIHGKNLQMRWLPGYDRAPEAEAQMVRQW